MISVNYRKHAHIQTYTNKCTKTYATRHAHIQTYIYTLPQKTNRLKHIHFYKHAHTKSSCIHKCTNKNAHNCTNTDICPQMDLCSDTVKYMLIYMHIHMCTYLTHQCTLIQKKSLIHTYTNKFSSLIHTHAFNTFAKTTKAHVCCIYSLNTPQFFIADTVSKWPLLTEEI